MRFAGAVGFGFANAPITLADRATEAIAPKAQGSGRPSIAVLLFTPSAASHSRLQITEALPEDIVTQPTNRRWLFMIARGPTLRFGSYLDRPPEIGHQPRVRYCLSGEVTADGADRLRVMGEGAETLGETMLWRESFGIRMAGTHALQQEVVRRIASELDRRITDREIAQACLNNPNDLDA
ncbi:MAG: hypothetical protein AAGH57_14625 [Pseudomonadota bacterium]